MVKGKIGALGLGLVLVLAGSATAQRADLAEDGTLSVTDTRLPLVKWSAVCAGITLKVATPCDEPRVAAGGCPVSLAGLRFPDRKRIQCRESDIRKSRCTMGIGEPVREDLNGDGEIDIEDAGVCGVDRPVGTLLSVGSLNYSCSTPDPTLNPGAAALWREVHTLRPGTWLVELVDCSNGEIWQDEAGRSTQTDCRSSWKFAPSRRDCRDIIEREFTFTENVRTRFDQGLDSLNGQELPGRPPGEELDLTP